MQTAGLNVLASLGLARSRRVFISRKSSWRSSWSPCCWSTSGSTEPSKVGSEAGLALGGPIRFGFDGGGMLCRPSFVSWHLSTPLSVSGNPVWCAARPVPRWWRPRL
jgi:hypothetical protein